MSQGSENRGKRPPFALFAWLLVFIAGLFIFIFRYDHSSSRQVEWTPYEFEQNLTKGNIVSAEIMPESDKILFIEGKFSDKGSAEDTDLSVSRKEDKLGSYSTRLYATDKLIAELHRNGVKVAYLQRDNWYKSLLFNVIVGVLIIGFIYFLFTRQMRSAGKGAMQFGRSKARMILPEEHGKKFDDVAGCDEAKEETKEIVDYLKDPLKFKMLGGKIPRGALLSGPPGTGKTLMAKAVSGESGVPFFAISGSDFVEMFVGV